MRIARSFLLALIGLPITLPAQTIQTNVPPQKLAAKSATLTALNSSLPLSTTATLLQAGQAGITATVTTPVGTDVPGFGYTQQRFSVNDIVADAVIYPFSNADNSGSIIRIGGGLRDTIYTIYTGIAPYSTIPISSNYYTCFSFIPTTAWTWDIAANNPGEDYTVPGSGNILNSGTAIVGLIYKACNAGSGWTIYPPPALPGSTGGSQTLVPYGTEGYSCATATAIVPGALPGMLALVTTQQGTSLLNVTAPNTVIVHLCSNVSYPKTPDARFLGVTVLP